MRLETYLKRIFWKLPRRLRRVLYPVFLPGSFKKLNARKHGVDDDGYSLEPFIKNKCIFVHIPKCAGISVSKSLFGNLGGGHAKIGDYMLAFGEKEFKDYFKFTFVRNPWDRIVSAFHFLKKGGMNATDENWAEKNISRFSTFDEFVKKWLNEERANSEIHFEEQFHFVYEPGMARLAIDFIGKFENIANDYLFIRNKLGIETRLQTFNATAQKKSRYQEYYTRRSVEIVERVYQADISLFGYRFD